VRRALEAETRRREEAEETSADVLEAAAGYSPTLGILGAVLGLIHVMENLTAPTKLGAGIAVAFVATVYGVGAANLLFLPLATKLRGVARTSRLTRELVIEGTSAIQRGVHPRLLEQHLAAYVRAKEQKQQKKEKLRPEAAA
jgi:chemotaxis protein MotA